MCDIETKRGRGYQHTHKTVTDSCWQVFDPFEVPPVPSSMYVALWETDWIQPEPAVQGWGGDGMRLGSIFPGGAHSGLLLLLFLRRGHFRGIRFGQHAIE